MDVVHVAESALGDDALSDVGPPGLHECSDGGYQVAVDLARPVRVPIAYALGLYATRSDVGICPAYREHAARYIAAALLISPAAWRRARARLGGDWPALAKAFGVPLDVVFRRLADLEMMGARPGPGLARARVRAPADRAAGAL